jgi:phage baseplate assembly protein W
MYPTIPTHLDWQPALGADGIVGGLADIDQCVRVILNSPKGCDPHNPDFACDIYRYIDWPQDRSVPYIIRDARAAILQWEPRIKEVKFAVVHTAGQIELTVDWLPTAGGNWQKTVVTLTAVSA